jgi:hypothetical protein
MNIMFQLALAFCILLNCNDALLAKPIATKAPTTVKATPAPSPPVIKLDLIDTTTTPSPEHSFDGPSKADIVIAATDHVGTIFDDIAREFNTFFSNLIHMQHPETTPPPDDSETIKAF